MAKNTLTVTDNRTGTTYTLPIENGTIRTMDLRQIKVRQTLDRGAPDAFVDIVDPFEEGIGASGVAKVAANPHRGFADVRIGIRHEAKHISFCSYIT